MNKKTLSIIKGLIAILIISSISPAAFGALSWGLDYSIWPGVSFGLWIDGFFLLIIAIKVVLQWCFTD